MKKVSFSSADSSGPVPRGQVSFFVVLFFPVLILGMKNSRKRLLSFSVVRN